MLISAAAELKRQGKEWRNLRLYGQELNYGTSAIARMNLFLHGITDGHIAHGDTLTGPRSSTPRAAADLRRRPRQPAVLDQGVEPCERSLRTPTAATYGASRPRAPPTTPSSSTSRRALRRRPAAPQSSCPHGVLDRLSEADVRARMVKSDLVEAVIGMAPGLFYNSAMEAVVLVLRSQKTKDRQGKILFINAKDRYIRVQAQSFLSPENQSEILNAYRAFGDAEGFAKVVLLSRSPRHDGADREKGYRLRSSTSEQAWVMEHWRSLSTFDLRLRPSKS